MVPSPNRQHTHGGHLLPWRTLGLLLVTAGLFLWFGPAPDAWVLDRGSVQDGEFWRLLSGHWVHSDVPHLFWNVIGLLLLGTLFERDLKWGVPLFLLVGALSVDVWWWWGMPRLQGYCGLSGALNTLLAAGLRQSWRDTRSPLVLVTGVAAVAKIVLEISTGQALFTETGWPGVPETHAAGFTAGLLIPLHSGTCRHHPWSWIPSSTRN
jgi:rhomboid family GlyGly-CTERM serine protease